jgi:hypothetical protein
MVAPNPGATQRPKKVKWRRHCSTCGVIFDRPSTWAYCSKHCEVHRRGRDPSESLGADEWLDPIYERRLKLGLQLEVSMPWERAKLLEQIAATEREEAAVREKLASNVAARDSVDFWAPLVRREADRFEHSMRKSLGFAIRLGKRLCEAKAALEHGEFGRLFADHPNPIESALSFSSSWARKLMAIGGHPAIANRDSSHDLPAHINTVYVLSRLPAPELEQAIARGEIRPDMHYADARRLLHVDADAGRPELAADDEIAQALGPVRAQLVAIAAEHPKQLRQLKARLRAVLRSIEDEVDSSRASVGEGDR